MTRERYFVQRRFGGVQGENGCYQDAGEFMAETAADAIAQALDGRGDSSGEYRACLAPEWETFFPRVVRTVTSEIVVGDPA